MKRFLYLIILCAGVCASVASSAQVKEICANSIDDDGDGFIDCFDGECAKETVCTGGYIGNDLNCEAKPSEFPKFSLSLESASPNGSAIHLGRIAVGDIDRDGTPEMITTNRYSQKIFILNGENTAGVNTIQNQITVDYDPSYTDILIGNLDNDNCAEIFTISTGWTLRAYDCNLNFLWSRKMDGDPGMMGLADFNGDGQVELYARNAIYNAHTGDIIVAPKGWGKDSTRPNGGPVAVDILNDATKDAHLLTDAIKDDNLELVVGDTIFSVNITAKSINAEKVMPDFGRKTDSDATSIADYNLDGSLDVIVSGRNTTDNNSTIFFWDVKTGVVKTYSDPIAGNFTIQACPPSTKEYYKNGWHQGTGRVNIADLDGDGKLNAAYVSGKYLYALKEDMTLLWKTTVNEETSGNTGCTLFDFNGDGQSEVVYRDEKFIYIIDGTNGNMYTQQPCVSRTNREYPIVADVDGDGNTELCVTCRTVDFVQNGTITDPTDPAYLDADKADFCDTPKSEFSQVRVFRSGAEPWVPARRVWNQHGYFNVNVNDNLSIPKIQQKHHLVFSENVCTVGKNRPLNSFLNQSPFLNSLGCPKYASPDLAYIQNSLTVTPPTCPNGNFTISFQITNLGDVSLSGTVPITFYNGDPTKINAVKLNTVNVSLNAFKVGGVQSITNATVNGPGSPFTLYIVLNDGGTTVPTPIKLPNTNFIECNYANNILSSPINPLPIALTVLKVKDNYKCSPGTSPDNGAVRAFVPNGAVENVTDYNFYWSIGNTAKPIASADHTGPTWTGRPDGTYTVYAIHKTANCASETKSVVVLPVSSPVNIKIVLENPYDNCKNPNAKLRAVINDTDGDGTGDSPGLYNFSWYAGNDALGVPIGNSDVKATLSPGAYTVLVEHKATGCKNIDTKNIVDQTVIPAVPTVTKTDALCSIGNFGSASASVGGVTAGYKFEWSDGAIAKPVPDHTGTTYTNLAPGKYTVVATRNSTECTSTPVVITIIKTVNPTVTASVVAPQTSCDAARPNGSASALVGGTTTGFKFEWFFGQNTLPANRVDTTSIAKGLKVGIYTVKATNRSTGCFDTEEVTINFAVVTPTIMLASSSHATQCTPANGSITIAVNPGTPTDYTFSWYKGSVVKAAPDFTDTLATLSGLPAGQYTVKAKFRSRFCETAPITVTINDASPVITLGNASDIIFPSDCNDNKGTMKVVVSAPGNTMGFDFEWRKGQDPFMEPAITTVANTSNTSVISALKPGLYTLIATNRNTGCSASKTYDLPFQGAHVLAFQYKVDPANCVPDNDGVINIKLNPAITFTESDYRIDVFAGKNDLGATATVYASKSGPLNNAEDWVNFTPNFYTFVAVSTNAVTLGCRSVPVTVELKQTGITPVFSLDHTSNNINCPGGPAFSGEIEITIANPLDYSYAWYEGPDSSSPVLGTNTSGTSSGTTATNLTAGKYTVVVTKTGTPSGGCFSTATYQLYDNLPVVSIPLANITPTPITLCDDLDGGSVILSGISENPGPAAALGGYLIEWYSSNISGPPIGTGSSISNLTAGPYYVKATNTTSGCSTNGLTEFTIEDNTMNTVNVDLQSFVVPTQCISPLADNVQGSLEVLASGVGNSYTYTWYEGQSATGPSIATGVLANNLGALFYTVDVFNNTTHCSISETFQLPLDKKPIFLNASAAPITSCIDTQRDGSVFATVTSAAATNYSYAWFIETVKATADFTSIPSNGPVSGLNDGNYIIVATDIEDVGCSASDTVTVTNGRIIPVVMAQPLAPLTTCDPARPDGVAAAHVNGEIIYHRFDWFSGAPPTGASFYTGSQASSLPAGLYSVIATEFVTGCSDTTQVTIDVKQLPVPIPTIEILSMVTSCIMDNGALTASVEDNTSDYIFDWYIGTVEKTTEDFRGETYDSLAVGPYAVIATSRITGCKSPLKTEQILNDPKYPEFSITTVATACRENSLEPGTGYAAIFMTNSVDSDSVFWSFGGSVISTGPIATGLNVGTYDVTVISALGCETTKPVSIMTEIHPFNGVSRNGDGQNDVFHINCIENFPSNEVKIFNRAGTMVYQAEGYDNNGTVFDGQSNRGVSLMGNNLPSGTYFYIIDKKDGTKPMAGYLEIVN